MEISPFVGTILGNIVIAIGILSVVGLVGLIKKKLIVYLDYITAITVGLLLGIIFLGFLPELVSEGFSGDEMGIYILVGIVFFYLLELFLHWHHCKELDKHDDQDSKHIHEHKNGLLMFGATMMHNAFHGVVLFVAFSVNLHFGIATTIAILLHSIPQNIANYIMNHKDAKYAYIAAIGGLIGALLTFPFADFLVSKELYVLSIISGGLLYTALADIFPEFKGKGTVIKKLSYIIFIFLGILLFIGFRELSHGAHGHDGDEHEAYNNNEQIATQCSQEQTFCRVN